MWGWIVKGLRPAARPLAAPLAAFAAGATFAAAPAPATAAPVVFAVPGGQVRVLDVPRGDREIRDAIVVTITEELAAEREAPVAPIDPARCPTGEVIVTLEKQATLQRKWAEVSADPKHLGGLLVRGAPCRVWLSARELRRLDDARICNIVRHELGHARGLDHTTSGLMAPTLPVLPVEGCEWAESFWLDTDA